MTKIVIACLFIAVVSFAQMECLGNEYKIDEIERIAIQFAEKILSGDTEGVPDMLPLTDWMRERYLETNSFKEWTSDISEHYGTAFERESVETFLVEDRYRTRIRYMSERGRMTVIVFFSTQKRISNFAWSRPSDGKQSNYAEWAMFLGFLGFVVLLPAIFLIMYFGEKWRTASVRNRAEWSEDRVIDVSETYRESQNPLWGYVVVLAIFLCVVPGIAASALTDPNVPLALTIFILGITSVIILATGLVFGMFVEVCGDNLLVRWGVLRFKVLTVPLASIRSAEVVTFSPIKDFGGWGIRVGKGGWAYFMSGTQGVQVVTNKNEKYIIGSDTPNLLYKVIQAKRGIEQADS